VTRKQFRASDIDRVEVVRELQRLWGDCIVRDAKVAFKLFVRQEDIDSATRKQPGGCVFARCFNRTCGTGKILFLKTIAYLEMPDENGHTVVERYMMPSSMRKMIEDFDRNGGSNLKAGTGFTLLPPTKANRLDKSRQAKRKWRRENPEAHERHKAAHREKQRARRQAKLKGQRKSVVSPGSMGEPIHMDTSGMEVRNGKGMVHFIVNTECDR
jgi:hypothetical protein